MGTARRWFQAQKKSIELNQPHLIAMYNKQMGEVDLMDQGVANLRFGIKDEKVVVAVFAANKRIHLQCLANLLTNCF